MNKDDLISELCKIRAGSTFLTLHNYQNNSGEIADHSIIFKFSYENALKKSIKAVEEFNPETDLQRVAKSQVLASWNNSLERIKNEPVEVEEGAYTRFFDAETGKHIDGLKMHTSGVLHIFGLANLVRIIKPGNYKKVNSAPLTLEKKALMRLGPVSRFRQFALTPEKVSQISVKGMQFLPPDSLM